MSGLDPVAAAVIRDLARQVNELERRVRDQGRASQARDRSVEGGAQYLYDENDDVRAIVGELEDGGYGIVTYGGDAPAAPSRPLLATFPGGATLTWDGFDANEEQSWDDTFARVTFHLSTVPGAEQDVETQIGSSESRDGFSLSFAQPPDVTTYATLVAWSTSGVRSAASEEVEVVAGALAADQGPTEPPAASPTVSRVAPMPTALMVTLAGDIDPTTTVLVEAGTDETMTTVVSSAEARARTIVVGGLTSRVGYWLRVTASNVIGSAAPAAVVGPYVPLQIEPVDIADLSLTVQKFATSRHQLY